MNDVVCSLLNKINKSNNFITQSFGWFDQEEKNICLLCVSTALISLKKKNVCIYRWTHRIQRRTHVFNSKAHVYFQITLTFSHQSIRIIFIRRLTYNRMYCSAWSIDKLKRCIWQIHKTVCICMLLIWNQLFIVCEYFYSLWIGWNNKQFEWDGHTSIKNPRHSQVCVCEAVKLNGCNFSFCSFWFTKFIFSRFSTRL